MKKLLWLALLLPTFVIAEVSETQHARLETHCAKDPGSNNKGRIKSCWAEEVKGRLETLEENTGNPVEGGNPIMAVDSNGLVIGELVSIGERVYGLGRGFTVFTTQEYLEVDILMQPGGYGQGLLYRTTDCSGVPFSINFNGTVFTARQLDGVLAKYYVSKDSVALNIRFHSVGGSDMGTCHTIPEGSLGWYHPASQNVPAITGVADIIYELPITFQRQ
jgi:hypothetical protein